MFVRLANHARPLCLSPVALQPLLLLISSQFLCDSEYLAGLRPDDVYPGPESAPVGFGFQPIQFPQRVNVAATDDRVVIAYGNGATLDALETQTSPVAGRISELLGDGFAPRAFVDVEKLRGFTQLVSGELTGAARVMADLGVVALGTKTSDERVSHRLVVTAPGPRDED